MITKSGANAFHGDLFEYLRNGDVNARNFFATSRDSLKRNQFGGTIGGRIIRDKLFFFGGYQGTYNRSNPATTTTYIPTAAMLQGNFNVPAGCPNAGNDNGSTPFPNNQIPAGQLNPVAQKFATQFLPLGTADQCGKRPVRLGYCGIEYVMSLVREAKTESLHTGFLPAVVALSGAMSFAQMNVAEIDGVVTDPAGEVVSGAAIAVTNTATGLKFNVLTNNSGQYLRTQTAGPYRPQAGLREPIRNR